MGNFLRGTPSSPSNLTPRQTRKSRVWGPRSMQGDMYRSFHLRRGEGVHQDQSYESLKTEESSICSSQNERQPPGALDPSLKSGRGGFQLHGMAESKFHHFPPSSPRRAWMASATFSAQNPNFRPREVRRRRGESSVLICNPLIVRMCLKAEDLTGSIALNNSCAQQWIL